MVHKKKNKLRKHHVHIKQIFNPKTNRWIKNTPDNKKKVANYLQHKKKK